MGKYRVVYENEQVKKHLLDIKHSGNQANIKKVERIIQELAETPYTGTGKPEILKYQLSGMWSRRINQKDRLVYTVNEETSIVYILSAKGHYNDR